MQFRIAGRLILHHKRNTMQYTFLLTCLFALFFIIFSLFQGLEANLTKSYQEKYGEQHFIVYDVASGEKEVLWEKRDEARVSVKNWGLFIITEISKCKE
jgi:hypothetical protein